MMNPHIPFAQVCVIRRGAEGTVNKATRQDTDDPKEKIIAVKAVNLGLSPDERDQQIELLNLQFELISKLNHENVVRHITGMYDDVHQLASIPIYSIVMEYCDGGTLHEACGYRTSAFYIRKWTKETLSGLDYLYNNGIVHRDIKGDNILLNSRNLDECHVKICDLGQVKHLLNGVTKSKEVTHGRGTWAFMSPEMIANNQKIGRKTDIWSLGCTVLEMLQGKVSFSRTGSDGAKIPLTTEMSVLFHVANDGYPDIPDGCPSSIVNFIKRCLQRNVDDRPTAGQLLDDPFITMPGEDILTWAYTDNRQDPPIESYSYSYGNPRPMPQLTEAPSSDNAPCLNCNVSHNL